MTTGGKTAKSLRADILIRLQILSPTSPDHAHQIYTDEIMEVIYLHINKFLKEIK